MQTQIFNFISLFPPDALEISDAWKPAFQLVLLNDDESVRNLLQENSICGGEAGIGGSTNEAINNMFNFGGLENSLYLRDTSGK